MHVYVIKATHFATGTVKEMTVQSLVQMIHMCDSAVVIEELIEGRKIILTKFETDNSELKAHMEYSYYGGKPYLRIEAVQVEVKAPDTYETRLTELLQDDNEVADEALDQAKDEFNDIMKRLSQSVDPKAN